jgi:magnesium chelatase subunit I
VRSSPAVDHRSGVSARFGVACAEGVAAAALRRGALTGEDEPVARVGDLAVVVPTLRGKVEFEMGHEGREREVLEHLARTAVGEVYRDRMRGADLSAVTDRFAQGVTVEDGDLVPSVDIVAQLGPVPGLAGLLARLGMADAASAAEVASGVELLLEGLHLTRRLGKDDVDGRTVYAA